jgi:hypothetical protein
MADQFDTFKKEVEEDLNRERMQKLWEQYGTYILGAAAALVLSVAGWKFFDNRRQAAAEYNAVRYVGALRNIADNKAEDGQKELAAIAAATPGGYGLLAKLRLAAADATAGQTDKAFAAYDAIARQPGVDKVLADYARLQSAMLKIDSAEWTETQNRLIDLAADANPWKYNARELLGFSAFRTGRLPEARQQFERLVADPAAPPAIKERAGIVMAEIAQAELAKTQAGAAPAAATPPATSPQPAAKGSAPETPGTKKK